jgi:hypothetical protein
MRNLLTVLEAYFTAHVHISYKLYKHCLNKSLHVQHVKLEKWKVHEMIEHFEI